ncbi:MAG: hypothetical protein C4541_07735 [Candidatus Auribacter fodinae]|uniref:Uncharacterized protein n=1 Tax=Candidatus Auribacter fodinae TaxID=2093366 RepID=A0A3A4R6V6_9BACT|nr:MAG: hypothetical protein C4541_07735 [Candidatus Auribacter fodinae]
MTLISWYCTNSKINQAFRLSPRIKDQSLSLTIHKYYIQNKRKFSLLDIFMDSSHGIFIADIRSNKYIKHEMRSI